MNKFCLTGNLTKDPEVMGKEDKKVAKVSIATRRTYVKEGSDVSADFIPLTFFGKQAEFAEKYLKKGNRIEVSGRVENNDYTNKDGQKVYGFQFIVEIVEFGGGAKKDEELSEHPEPKPEPKPKPEIPDIDDEDDDEDLPFH